MTGEEDSKSSEEREVSMKGERAVIPVFIFLIFFSAGCYIKDYERNNPLDPYFTGGGYVLEDCGISFPITMAPSRRLYVSWLSGSEGAIGVDNWAEFQILGVSSSSTQVAGVYEFGPTDYGVAPSVISNVDMTNGSVNELVFANGGHITVVELGTGNVIGEYDWSWSITGNYIEIRHLAVIGDWIVGTGVVSRTENDIPAVFLWDYNTGATYFSLFSSGDYQEVSPPFDLNGGIGVVALSSTPGNNCIWTYDFNTGSDYITYISDSIATIEDVAAGDIDGDGFADVVIVSFQGGGVYAYGNGGSYYLFEGAGGGYAWTEVIISDIDGDGTGDVIVEDPNGGVIGAFDISGNMKPGFPFSLSQGAGFLSQIIAADVDGDGHAEIIYAAEREVGALDYDGQTVHPVPGFWVTPPEGRFFGAIAVGDVILENGDAPAAELIVGGGAYQDPGWGDLYCFKLPPGTLDTTPEIFWPMRGHDAANGRVPW